MPMLRRILHSGRGSVILFAALAASLLLAPPHVARACWQNVLTECFDAHISPLWAATSNNATFRWDVDNRYFDTHMCQDDQNAAWIGGYVPSNDPQFTPYPPNLDTYLVWGPASLAQAQAAAVSFWMLDISEAGHDSVFWGASLSAQLTNANMMLAGSYSGEADDNWELRNTDLAHLRTPAGDTISYLGQPTVYLFWRFRSDGNSNPPDHVPLNFGAIIDNVSFAIDNGGVDLFAVNAQLDQMDGSQWQRQTRVGDSTYARFDWSTCSGGSGIYPPFRVMGVLDDGTLVLDTLISTASEGHGDTLVTQPWVIAVADTHWVRFVLDTLGDVNETDETNNVFLLGFRSAPQHFVDFHWINPGDSALHGQTTVTLRWEAHCNPALPATVIIASSANPSGCVGAPLPGGTARPVLNGPDSLVWNITQYGYGVPRYVFAQWYDYYVTDSCINAPAPVVRLDVDQRQGNGIPERFYLSQNYPNPFNPSTDLEFGVAKYGRVTLRVFDVLGRQVAELVNGERSPGTYSATFDGSKLPSGLYMYSITTPEGTSTRKMMLLK